MPGWSLETATVPVGLCVAPGVVSATVNVQLVVLPGATVAGTHAPVVAVGSSELFVSRKFSGVPLSVPVPAIAPSLAIATAFCRSQPEPDGIRSFSISS